MIDMSNIRNYFLLFRNKVYQFEITILLLLTLLLVGLLGNYYEATIAYHHTDTAFLMELIEKTFDEGEPVSYILSTTVDASKTWALYADKVCSLELKPTTLAYNVLDNHAYYAVYAISALAQFFAPEVIFSYLNALAFIALLLFSFLFLRHNRISVLGVIVFVLLLALNPVWAYAALGDYYLDRIYMPLALAYLMAMHLVLNDKEIASRWWVWVVIVTLGVMAAAMTERAAIMIGLASFAMLFVHWKSDHSIRLRLIFIGLGVVFLSYAYWYVSFRFVGVSTGGALTGIPQMIMGIWTKFSSPQYAQWLKVFLLVNFGMLGVFAFFAGIRVALVAIAVLLPNIVITVGGAELTGWTTHYHSMYFPFLLYCSIVGYIKFKDNEFLKKFKLLKLVIIAFPFVLGLIFNPYDGSFHQPSKDNYRSGIIYNARNFYKNPPSDDWLQLTEKLREAVPSGSKVSTIEGVMPSLYNDRRVYYYPIGIDDADYVVLGNAVSATGEPYLAGAISYQGESEKLDLCLTKRLYQAGYDIDNAVRIRHLSVIKRVTEIDEIR